MATIRWTHEERDLQSDGASYDPTEDRVHHRQARPTFPIISRQSGSCIVSCKATSAWVSVACVGRRQKTRHFHLLPRDATVNTSTHQISVRERVARELVPRGIDVSDDLVVVIDTRPVITILKERLKNVVNVSVAAMGHMQNRTAAYTPPSCLQR